MFEILLSANINLEWVDGNWTTKVFLGAPTPHLKQNTVCGSGLNQLLVYRGWCELIPRYDRLRAFSAIEGRNLDQNDLDPEDMPRLHGSNHRQQQQQQQQRICTCSPSRDALPHPEAMHQGKGDQDGVRQQPQVQARGI